MNFNHTKYLPKTLFIAVQSAGNFLFALLIYYILDEFEFLYFSSIFLLSGVKISFMRTLFEYKRDIESYNGNNLNISEHFILMPLVAIILMAYMFEIGYGIKDSFMWLGGIFLIFLNAAYFRLRRLAYTAGNGGKLLVIDIASILCVASFIMMQPSGAEPILYFMIAARLLTTIPMIMKSNLRIIFQRLPKHDTFRKYIYISLENIYPIFGGYAALYFYPVELAAVGRFVLLLNNIPFVYVQAVQSMASADRQILKNKISILSISQKLHFVWLLVVVIIYLQDQINFDVLSSLTILAVANDLSIRKHIATSMNLQNSETTNHLRNSLIGFLSLLIIPIGGELQLISLWAASTLLYVLLWHASNSRKP
jgi:hypothetical protein